jgi:hypothetical protein
VLDALTDQPTEWVARLAPAQSHGWRIYADFLATGGHTRIAAATAQGDYWASGIRILRECLAPRGGSVVTLAVPPLDPAALCEELVGSGATALLLLLGHPEPAVSIVRAVRADQRCAGVLIGAPAGQPEFDDWATILDGDGAGVPFLRYLPESLSPLGARVAPALRQRLGESPSFVAFEGYDTVTVLVDALRSHGVERTGVAASWPRLAVQGTRGPITFQRAPGTSVWQWAWTPTQVVDRDPADPQAFRIRYAEP